MTAEPKIELTKSAFDGMVGILDDALSLAEEMSKLAEAAQTHKVPQDEVSLVKVASAEICNKTAAALFKSGMFRGMSKDVIADSLRDLSPDGHLQIMEKLASEAIFPLEFPDPSGMLVEKNAASTPGHAGKAVSKTTAVWQQARDEAVSECEG